MDFWKLSKARRAVLASILSLLLALSSVSPQALAEAMNELSAKQTLAADVTSESQPKETSGQTGDSAGAADPADKSVDHAEPVVESVPERWAIELDANGGALIEGTDEHVTSVESQEDADPVRLPNAFVREGFEFAGWSTNVDPEAWHKAREEALAADPNAPEPEDKPLFVPAEASLYNLSYAYVTLEDGTVRQVSDVAAAHGTDGEGREVKTCVLRDRVRDGKLVLYAQWKKVEQRTEQPTQEATPSNDVVQGDQPAPANVGDSTSASKEAPAQTSEHPTNTPAPAQPTQEATPSNDITQDDQPAPTNAGGNMGAPKEAPAQTSERSSTTATPAQPTQSVSVQPSEDTGGIDPNVELPKSAEPVAASPTGIDAILANPEATLDSSAGDPNATVALDKAEQNTHARNLLANPLQVRSTASAAKLGFGTLLLSPQSVGNVTDVRARPGQEQKKDGTTVEYFSLVWNTHDTEGKDDGSASNLYLEPADDNALNMQAHLQFSFSGEMDYPAGSIQMTVPAQVALNRGGDLIGSMTFGVPEQPDTSQAFAYRLVTPTDSSDPYYVITNTRTLQSGSTGVIQFSIHGIVPHEIKSTELPSDMVVPNLQAELTLTTARGNDIVVGTDPLTAQVHTHEEIDNAYKNGGRVVAASDAEDAIKAALNGLPGSADDYVLVRWNTYANVKGNQAFQLNMTDTIGKIEGNGEEVSNEGSVVLGTSSVAADSFSSSYTKTVLENGSYLESGESRYENVWTAYPKSLFEDGVNYKIANDVSWTVTPTDAPNTATHKEASAAVYYHNPSPVAFVAAPGHYIIEKETLEPHRYSTSTNTALTDLKGLGSGANAIPAKDTTIGFTVTAYGEIMERTLAEGASFENVTDPATDPNLHQRYVTMEATDDAIYLNGNYGSELTSADYYISRVHLNDPGVYTYGHRGGDVNNEWDYIRNYEATPPNVALWGLSESEGGTAQEWTQLATVTYDEHNAHHVTTTLDRVHINGLNVSLDKELGITRVKMVTSSKDYDAIRLQYNPYVTLCADGPRVRALVDQLFAETDSPTATMRNDVTLVAYNGDGVGGTYGSGEANAPTVNPADASLVAGTGDGIFAIRGNPNQSVGFSNTIAMDTSRYGRPMYHHASLAYLRGSVPRIGVTSTKETKEYNEGTDFNASTKQVTLHYTATVHEQSNVLSKEIYEEYVENGGIAPETSGTWYDLLPPGVHPDLSTIRLRDEDSVLDAYTIEDYQGTGRTMLVVQAGLVPQLKYNDVVEGASAGDGYWSQGIYDELELSFDAVYNYGNFEATLDEHGHEVDKLVNLIAFESGNEELGNQEGMMGEYDDATGGAGDTKVYRNKETSVAVEDTPDLTEGHAAEVMSNLDGSLGAGEKKPTFVYARDETSIHIERYSLSEIRKTVASDAEGIYRTGTSNPSLWPSHNNQVNVYEGHGYSYRIEVGRATGETSNIVLYDALEYYQLNESNSDWKIKDHRWKGTLVSVDTSHLEAAGVSPVVYYSTTVGGFDSNPASTGDGGYVNSANFQNTNLQDTSLWKPASSYPAESLPNVTAVAIDCSKAADGSDFILPAESSLVAVIHMKAPTEVIEDGKSNLFKTVNPGGSEDEPNDNSHAFNNVYIMNDVKGGSSAGTETQFYHPDYVKVGIVPFKLRVSKIWDDANNNDGKRPDQVKVHLHANGQAAKDENGDDVAAVILNEGNEWTHTFEDIPYADEHNKPIHYTVTEDDITEEVGDGTTVRLYAPSYLHTDDAHVQIVNKRTPETVDVRGTKTWEDNGDAAGARPSTIRVHLYADGSHKSDKYVGEATDGTWSYSFNDLPAYKDGKKIVYTVEEDPIAFYARDYEASTDGSSSFVAADGTVQGSTNITNTYSTTGLLGISKTAEGVISEAGRNATFTFKVELFDAQKDDNGHAIPLADAYPYYVIDASTGTKVEGSDGTVSTGGTVSCKAGQRAIIAGIPVGSTYRVTEQPTAGFYQSGSANATGTIVAGVNPNHAEDARFTNTYRTSGSFQLKATKELQNQKLALYGFRFQAYQVFNAGKSDEYEQVVRSVSNAAGGEMDASGVSTGEVTFARVNVSGEDLGDDGRLELLYRIREVNVGRQGYTYADNVEQVRVTLTDAGDGTITATQEPMAASGTSHIRSLDGTTTTDSAFVSNGNATFRNTYSASGTFDLTALKVLKGRALTDGEFTLRLTALTADAPAATTATATNDANGVVTFHDIPLTGAHGGKCFIYKITEDAGSDSGVVYSGEAVYYRVDVTDNGDGTMSSTQTVVAPKAGASNAAIEAGDLDAFEPSGASPTITNTLKPGSLKIKKLLDGAAAGHEDQEFTFKVRLTGSGLASSYTYTVDGAGTPIESEVQDGVFEVKLKLGQEAEIANIPAGTTYAVFEDTVAGWQLLSQSGTSGTIAPNAASLTTITNQYVPGEAKVQLFATKTLDGASASKAFEFVLAGNAGAPMPTGATEGTVTASNDTTTGLVDFGSIAYDTPGTYTYTITEKLGYADGAVDNTIEYDATEWTATVTVTNTGTDAAPVFSTAVSYSNGVDEPSATPPTFANTTKLGELTVEKVGQNITPKNKDAEFDFTVELQNDGQPVDKASFYITDADGNIVEQNAGTQSNGGVNSAMGMTTLLSGVRDAFVGLFKPTIAYADDGGPSSGVFGKDGSCTWEWDGAGTFTIKATDSSTPAVWEVGMPPIESYKSDMVRFVVDASDGPIKVRGSVKFGGSSTESSGMFSGYPALTTVNLSGFDVSEYQSDLNSADTADRTLMRMFYNCGELTTVVLPEFTGYAVATNHMFDSCVKLESVSIPHMNMKNGTSSSDDFHMFFNCKKLTNIDLSGVDIKLDCDMRSMFQGCSMLTSVNMGLKGSERITSMDFMFRDCSNLSTINFNGINAPKLKTMSHAFHGCTSLTALDLTDMSAKNIYKINGAFQDCENLQTLDISTLGFNFNKPTGEFNTLSDARNMLNGAEKLSRIVLGADFRSLVGFPNGYGINNLPSIPQTGGYKNRWIMVEDSSKPAKTYTELMAIDGRENAGTWVWEVEPAYKYVVNFQTNGAYYDTDNNAVPGSVTKAANESITLPTPKWDNDSKTFAGWYTTKDFSGTQFKGGSTYTKDELFGTSTSAYTTLYAKWDSNSATTGTVEIYHQKTDLSDSYDLVSSNPIEFDSTGVVSVPAAPDGFVYNPSKFAYTGGGTPTYDATASTYTVTPTDGATLRFYYNRQAYTVAFDANYGADATGTSGTMNPMPVAVGAAKRLPANAFAWEGHTFLGWNTAADGSGTPYTDQAQIKNLTTNSESVTLHAQWVAGSSSSSSTGIYSFKLKPGQTVHFANVPAGTRYNVVESTELPNGWTQTATDNVTGTVPANNVAEASVTNRYDAAGVVSLEASKTMRSGLLDAGQFSFQLKKGDDVLQTVTNLEPAEGTATGQIMFDPLEYQLSDLFEGGTYTGKKTYTYTIAEVVPAGAEEQTIDSNTVYTSGGVIYGADGVRTHTVTVEVEDAGTGRLNVTSSTASTPIAFVNDYEPGSLEVTKTTTGTTEASSGKTFTFSVKLTDAQGNPVNGHTYNLVRIADDGTETPDPNGAQFVNGTAAITGVHSGESFRIEGIAKDATYEVSEFGVPAGFTQTAASGETGTIGAGTKSQASFTNAYEAAGNVELKANKTLTDGNIADYAFTFQLYDETNTLLQTKQNDATGVVTFDKLGFSAADAGTRSNPRKYTYKIAEVNDAQKNVAYDTHSGWLDVSVWDEGTGELTVQAVYDHEVGDSSTTPETFKNKLLHLVELPATGGNGLAIPIAVAVIVATGEGARRMHRRRRE